ncbi:hypothetical protein D1610_11580 [Sphingomonas gilva]|uniref:Uncharacterized protein n=1 Tax=Sphingomonas gilva TaxID=2305907 RepID=A0A396RS86_9SPHN|nr:hypothetical protein [Sphingomonas gilva]RHW17183.1 hypothetical protein D1610_11580 [Sphingomonas gilva]
MLSACAHSPQARPAIEPDPVVQTRTVTRTVCPAELLLDIPAQVAMPAGAAIVASDETLAWLSARWDREALLEQRLADARAECP